MTRPVIDQKSNYNRYRNTNGQTTPPVINGYFPETHKTYKEMAISRVNKTLCAILAMFILISAVSYYFVTSSEITLNKYRKQVLALNDENVELQNKLDYLKSYYNVDKAMQKNIHEFTIIHGHGTGALKKAIRDYLNDSPYVLKYRAGEDVEGGDGATIVDVK